MPEVLRKVRNWIGHPIQNVKSVVGMIGTRDPKLEEGQSFPAIIVNKDNQTLRYYDADGKEVFKSRVSTGLNPGNKEKEGDQRTSSGTFKITNKANVNPNKFGSTSAYWTNMTNPNGSSAEVGIHGDAGYPDRIGTRASHGCIRMPTANYEALSKYLGPGSGTTVIIRGNNQGGYLNYLEYAKGGNIHIKKSHEGKFTEYCGGKVTEKCIQKGKHSPSAKIRKQATFAANARKWKH